MESFRWDHIAQLLSAFVPACCKMKQLLLYMYVPHLFFCTVPVGCMRWKGPGLVCDPCFLREVSLVVGMARQVLPSMHVQNGVKLQGCRAADEMSQATCAV